MGRHADRRLTEAAAVQLKEGGFNTVWGSTIEELDIAARHGLRVIFDLGIDKRDVSDPAVAAKVEADIRRVKDHPALFFYHHRDEPSADLFEKLAREKDWVATIDPDHPLWSNLLPSYANNRQLGIEGEIISAYFEYVRRFCDVYQPAFLSHDHYQFTGNGDNPNYFFNLGVIRKNAAARGVPFMNVVQACTWVPTDLASPAAPRIPGADELRYLTYTTVACGAQGLQWYVYSHPTHYGTIAAMDGTTGEKYETVKALNRAFVALAKELRGRRMRGAYFLGRQDRGTTPFCVAAGLDVEPKVPNEPLAPKGRFVDTTLVTRFASSDGDRFMVVNLDYGQDRTVTVRAPTALERFDVLTGTWSPAADGPLALDLEKGGGVLLRQKAFVQSH